MAGFNFLQKKKFHPGTFENIRKVKQLEEQEEINKNLY